MKEKERENQQRRKKKPLYGLVKKLLKNFFFDKSYRGK